MKLKKYKKKTLGLYMSREIIVVILAFILAIIIINYLYKQFNAVVMPLAETKASTEDTEDTAATSCPCPPVQAARVSIIRLKTMNSAIFLMYFSPRRPQESK